MFIAGFRVIGRNDILVLSVSLWPLSFHRMAPNRKQVFEEIEELAVELQYPIRTLKPPDTAEFGDFLRYLLEMSRFVTSEAGNESCDAITLA